MNKKYYLNSAIVVLLMALFRFIPPIGSMTTLGMTILGIFLGALWGWITCDMIWPSVLALVMLGFSGYTANVSEALTSTISNGTIQLILWLLVFSAVLTTTGISKYFVTKLVRSRFCKGHPWRLSIVICLATWICAAFGAGFAAILLCWDLVYTISAQVGYTKKDKWPKMMVCAVIFFNALGALALPFQAGVVTNFGFMFNASNNAYTSYNYIQYLVFSLVFCACTTVVYWLFCRFFLRPDMSLLQKGIEVEEVSALTSKQKFAIGALVALIVLTIIPSCLPAGGAKTFLNTLGTTAIVLLIIVFLTFPRMKDGKPFFTFKELANGGILWPMLFMVATATTIGGALSSAATGFTNSVIQLFSPVFSNASPYVFSIFACLATLALTNVINNTVAAAIMIPVMYPFASQMGVNPLMMTAMICFCANCGLLLPCASPAGAMLHGNKEWVSTKEVELHSLLGIAALALMVILVGIPFGNIIFG